MNTLIELCSLADAYRSGEGNAYYMVACNAAYAAQPMTPEGRMPPLTAYYLERAHGAVTSGMRDAHRTGYNAALSRIQNDNRP